MAKTLLTFLIPVRHQANARSWALLKSNLEQTSRSIAAQVDPRWQAVVVANHGADLPSFPNGFTVVRVDLPPNPQYEIGKAALENVYEAVRLDKGQRILAGLLETKPQGHVMLVDDDDFVSNRLAGFVAQNSTGNGWFIKNGYIWSPGGHLLLRNHSFSQLCGTSHIVRSDLLSLPERSGGDVAAFVKRMFGSHIFIASHLEATGRPLEPLPFYGAVYRVGHEGAHSNSPTVRQTLVNGLTPRRPLRAIRQLARLGWLTERLKREFFG